MRIELMEVFTIRHAHCYWIGGHEEAPGPLAGIDYYVEPQWVHVVEENGSLRVLEEPGIGKAIEEDEIRGMSSERWVVKSAGRRLQGEGS
jgi:hypothetical protein